MNPPLVATALPGQPERPFKYVFPVTAQDGSAGYNHPLENYFDVSMAPRLLPSKPPTRLYDTIARAHDHRFQVTPDMVDPSWPTPRPLILNPRERSRSLAKLRGNATNYMGISPDLPGWRPRRSSYEDRRGAVGVTPSEVNTLLPYIPPIDTSSPPPSREWLDAMAKKFLADAHADFEDTHHHATNNATTEPGPSLGSEGSAFFDYDTDSTLGGVVTVARAPVPQPSQPVSRVESEPTTRDNDFTWSSDSDTDTETDTDTSNGYSWTATRISESDPLTSADARRWIIPRKRPSVIIHNKEVTRQVGRSSRIGHGTSPSSCGNSTVSPPSSEDEQAGKRRRGRKSMPSKRVSKKLKRHATDTPVRQGGKSIGVRHILDSEEDSSVEYIRSLPPPARTTSFGNGTAMTLCPPVPSIAATTLQMKQVRIASPRVTSPQALSQSRSTSVTPKSLKVFPCRLDGCNQVCASAGDLQRHQQSLRHSTPSHSCLACGKSYTRPDALKRHLNSKASCKRVHGTKMANHAQVEEVQVEANREAV